LHWVFRVPRGVISSITLFLTHTSRWGVVGGWGARWGAHGSHHHPTVTLPPHPPTTPPHFTPLHTITLPSKHPPHTINTPLHTTSQPHTILTPPSHHTHTYPHHLTPSSHHLPTTITPPPITSHHYPTLTPPTHHHLVAIQTYKTCKM
jgi:hypothetical protein